MTAPLKLKAAAELELRRRRKAQELADNLIDWAKPLLLPNRYKCLFGGRGSGKSYVTCDVLLILGLTRKVRVLCAREFQISIKQSVHALLKQRIEELGLSSYYEVLDTLIRGKNGSEFIFKGIRHNIESIKSMAGITHCWIEEAQTISAESWRVLVPTIREEGSEILVTFNPNKPTDTVYQELVANTKPNSYVRQVNWSDNPYFPQVLDDERRAMAATDPDAYQHIWEGGFWSKSDAQILTGKWIVDEFKPLPGEGWDGPYFGADFGFADDPTTLIKCWIFDERLFIEYESYAHRLELDETAARWRRDVPGCADHIVKADCARPESISYLSRNGIPGIEAAPKWKGSILDGIAYLRSFRQIVIHPRCPKTAEEARLYCYKVDRLTEEILPEPASGFEHIWDGIRYALSPLIQQVSVGTPEFLSTGRRRTSSGASWR